MSGYNRPEGGWTYTFDGINTVEAPDHLNPTQYPLAVNIRGLAERSVRTRPGYTVFSSFPPTPEITTACPTGSLDLEAPYTYQLEAVGGYPPYTWTITAGALPTGLTLNPSTGLISGTPTVGGTFNWTATVTDSFGSMGTLSCSTHVGPDELAILECPTENPAQGIPYSFFMTATGGVPPYSWELTGGSFPNGITIDPDTGEISGSASEAGTFPWTVTVTDAQDTEAHIDCEFVVAAEVIRPTASTVAIFPGLFSFWTDIENAYDTDPDSYATQSVSVTAPSLWNDGSYEIGHFYDWQAFSTVGLSSVDIYAVVSIDWHSNVGTMLLRVEMMDGIDTKPNHGSVGGLSSPSIPGGSLSGDVPWTVLHVNLTSAEWLAIADPTMRAFIGSSINQALFSPPVDMNIKDIYLIPNY